MTGKLSLLMVHSIRAYGGGEKWALQTARGLAARGHRVAFACREGSELADQAALLRPEMKILLMSGYTDEISKAGFLHPGLQFIEKPFTSNSLALKIREVLDHSGS